MEKKKIILPIMCFCAISMVPSCDKSKTCSVTEGEYNEIVNSIVDNKSFVGNLTNNSFATYSMPERIEGYYAVNKDAEAHFTPNYDETFKYDYTWAKINNIWKKLKLIDYVSGDVYEEEATAKQRELHIILDCLDYSKGKFKDATFGVDKDDPDEDDLSYSFTNPSYTIANIEYSVKSLLKFAPRMHYEGDKLVTKISLARATFVFFLKEKPEEKCFYYNFDFLTNTSIEMKIPTEDQIVKKGQVDETIWQSAFNEFKKGTRNMYIAKRGEDDNVEVYEYNEPYEKVTKVKNGSSTLVQILKSNDNGTVNSVYPDNPKLISFKTDADAHKTNAEHLIDNYLYPLKDKFAKAKYDSNSGTYTVPLIDDTSSNITLSFDLRTSKLRDFNIGDKNNYTIYDYGEAIINTLGSDVSYSQESVFKDENIWKYFIDTLVRGHRNYLCDYTKTVDGTKEGSGKTIIEMSGSEYHKVHHYDKEEEEIGKPDYYKYVTYAGLPYYQKLIYNQSEGKYIEDGDLVRNYNLFSIMPTAYEYKSEDFSYNKVNDCFDMNESVLVKQGFTACHISIEEDGTLTLTISREINEQQITETYVYRKYGTIAAITDPREQ